MRYHRGTETHDIDAPSDEQRDHGVNGYRAQKESSR